jgi:glutathione-independent formaldehyde dehydrogenase
MAELVNPGGRVMVIGLWPQQDSQSTDASVRTGRLRVPWAAFFNKGISIVMGRDEDERWNRKLRDMIITGTAKPSRIVSHRLSLDEAAGAYAKFDIRADGYIKVVLKP